MKPILALLILACMYPSAAQDDKRFDNFHGLRHPQNGEEYFEAEGYYIATQIITYKLDQKGIDKVKKRYNLKGYEPVLDSLLQIKVFRARDVKDGVTSFTNIYLLPLANGSTRMIGFSRAASYDIIMERWFIRAYQKKAIPSSVFTGVEIRDIDFVGRTIELGSSCHWMGPHNVQCPNLGQMNWAIFNDLKSAEDYRDSRVAMAKGKGIMDFKEETWVPVKFEGTETKALRTKIKVQLPKLVMGGSNVLIVYYVTTQIRGKYVTCVLSHYTDDVGADKLPPLLSEVMELIP